MANKSIITLLALAALALGGYSIYLSIENGRLRADLASMEAPAAPTDEAATEAANLRAENAALRQGMERYRNEAAAAAIPEPAPAAEARPAGETESTRLFRELNEVVKSPMMNDLMVAQQKGTIEHLYGGLADELGLSPEEREHFMALLVNRQMGIVNLSLEMMGGASEERRAELAQQIKEASDAMKGDMEYFLNNEADYGRFKYYEDSMGERMAAGNFEKLAAQNGMPIDAATKEKLIDQAFELRKDFPFTHDPGDSGAMPDAERFTDAAIAQLERELAAYNEQLIRSVAPLLTPEQLEQYRLSQQQMAAAQVSQMRMAARFFGGKK